MSPIDGWRYTDVVTLTVELCKSSVTSVHAIFTHSFKLTWPPDHISVTHFLRGLITLTFDLKMVRKL